ncbi:MAG: heparinase II/III family protein [Pirellulales bacterium]|nr:heparinase II/III family protein [Pirellulales bacterium]
MKQPTLWGMLLILFSIAPSFARTAGDEPPVDPGRIEFFKRCLPEKPQGVGPAIADRRAWEEIGKRPEFANVVKKAEDAAKKPLPELTDDLYLEFSRTGNRTHYQKAVGKWYDILDTLIYAECLENRGRFLPAIERTIKAFCDMKTWVLPAHDGGLKNFRGESRVIDLRSAHVSWELATAAYWLGEKLSPPVRRRIAEELRRRTFQPWESYLHTGKPEMNWPRSKGNWNAVCLAGVTGAALANVESLERRAFFAAAAEKGIQKYLDGFSPDGYCSEGIGYWNYGFGHYVMLAETLRRATGNKLDWLKNPRLKPIALAPVNLNILPGVYPAFADCRLGTKPDAVTVACLSRRLNLGLYGWEARGAEEALALHGNLTKFGLFGVAGDNPLFPAEGTEQSFSQESLSKPLPLRSWFPDAGVLICRPGDPQNGLGAALKGGHNGEFHNHNDVGSFVVALRKSTPLLDLGSVVYDRNTFGKHRYENNVMNSFGHSVPRVAGKLQSTGSAARAKVLKTEFTDAQDTLVLDLRPAYDVAELKKLKRTFVFSRRDGGKMTVTDEVAFDAPRAFDTALVSFGPWKKIGDDELLLGEKPDAVRVKIRTEGGEFRLNPQEIHAEWHKKTRTPVRLGIQLKQPVTRAKVTAVITPAE